MQNNSDWKKPRRFALGLFPAGYFAATQASEVE